MSWMLNFLPMTSDTPPRGCVWNEGYTHQKCNINGELDLSLLCGGPQIVSESARRQSNRHGQMAPLYPARIECFFTCVIPKTKGFNTKIAPKWSNLGSGSSGIRIQNDSWITISCVPCFDHGSFVLDWTCFTHFEATHQLRWEISTLPYPFRYTCLPSWWGTGKSRLPSYLVCSM